MYIETDNLSCAIGKQRLWEGLRLRIERGGRVRIAGPSGCGKSTLLKCLMGFMPADGTIRIDGQTLDAVSAWRLRLKLAYIAQEPDLGSGNVLERLRQPFGYRHNAEKTFDLDALHQWMAYYRLPETILKKDIKTLSGGEKQRLAVILAVILGGAPPMTAILYQIAIMIAIFTGTAITVLLGIQLCRKAGFNRWGMLNQDIFR